MALASIPIVISRAISAATNGFNWFYALSNFEKGKFGSALIMLDNMRGNNLIMIQVELMKALVHHNLGNFEIAKYLTNGVRSRLCESQKLRAVERDYLGVYCVWLQYLGESSLYPSPGGIPAELRPEELEKITLSKVRRHWKVSFPLRVHPKWNHDSRR